MVVRHDSGRDGLVIFLNRLADGAVPAARCGGNRLEHLRVLFHVAAAENDERNVDGCRDISRYPGCFFRGLVLLVRMGAHEPERHHISAALLAKLCPRNSIGGLVAERFFQGLGPVIRRDIHHFKRHGRLVREHSFESKERKSVRAAEGHGLCAAAELYRVDFAAIGLFRYYECHKSLLKMSCILAEVPVEKQEQRGEANPRL